MLRLAFLAVLLTTQAHAETFRELRDRVDALEHRDQLRTLREADPATLKALEEWKQVQREANCKPTGPRTLCDILQ